MKRDNQQFLGYYRKFVELHTLFQPLEIVNFAKSIDQCYSNFEWLNLGYQFS